MPPRLNHLMNITIVCNTKHQLADYMSRFTAYPILEKPLNNNHNIDNVNFYNNFDNNINVNNNFFVDNNVNDNFNNNILDVNSLENSNNINLFKNNCSYQDLNILSISSEDLTFSTPNIDFFSNCVNLNNNNNPSSSSSCMNNICNLSNNFPKNNFNPNSNLSSSNSLIVPISNDTNISLFESELESENLFTFF
eukprot:TRINITY_DN3125_c0_g2_i1.p2 TRINITY_DN3125_c0_g2~~TRINITY_DN3125_c0_g2_i1.p2  ORF type:complete len:194 (+),score=58.09 TRINITY_DN3125_c0_g2_i1:857-1438(+)